MSNHMLAFILAFLVAVGLIFFFGGGNKTAEAPTTPTPMMKMNADGTHTMPDGTIMDNSNPVMNATSGMHMMPDGTMMAH